MADEEVAQEVPVQEEVAAQEDAAPQEATTDDAAQENKEDLPINPDHPEIARKMYVGGISEDTTDEEFKSHFAQYGIVADHFIKRKEEKEGGKANNPFGFITYCDADNIDECFKHRPHVLKGKTLDVRHAVPKGNTVPNANAKTKKLFVANLPRTLNKEEFPDPESNLKDELEKFLKSKFTNEEYGTIDKVQLVYTKDADGKATDQCKGYGFVEVSSEDFADKISLLMQFFEFGGRKCEIKKSDPNQSSRQGGGRPNMGRGGYQQYQQQGYGQSGYGYSGYGGYGYGGDYGYGGYPPYAGYPPYGGYGAPPSYRGRGQRYRPY